MMKVMRKVSKKQEEDIITDKIFKSALSFKGEWKKFSKT